MCTALGILMSGYTAFHLVKDIVGDIYVLVGCFVIARPELVKTSGHFIGGVDIDGFLSGGHGFGRTVKEVVRDMDIAGGIELYKMVGVHVKKRNARYGKVFAMTGYDALA